MKKKSLFVTIILLLIAIFTFSLTACDGGNNTLESITNEYGIVVDGGGFEEGSTLVSNEIVATTEEATAVLTAIADRNYNKDGNVYIFDIYVTKDGKEVQPNGKVKVSIPILNVQVDNYLVFHVKSDNSVENLVPTVADGKISFETSSFSYFVIAEMAPAEHVHSFGGWMQDAGNEDKHIRGCNCGATETADCTFDSGVVTQEPTHYEEGVKTYTCTECERIKTEPIAKTTEHEFGDWAPDQVTEDKHIRQCKCGVVERGDCTYDKGVVTKEPTHYEEGVNTYTCTECGRTKTEPIAKTTEHEFGDWELDQVTEDKHIRQCKCGEVEIGDCTYDKGVVTQEPTHYEEGVKTYTCTECGRTKTEPIEKTSEHAFGDWAPDATNENKHTRGCNCGATETADCTFDSGVVTKEPTHFEEGIKTYTCTVCERTKTEPIEKTSEHAFGDWAPDATNENKHTRGCNCGEVETADCTFDSGVVTKEPTHYEEGVKTYTCTVCGRIKTEPIAKTTEHEFGDWAPDATTEDKHIRECKCGATETADCTFDSGVVTKEPTHFEEGIKTYTCTECGRTKTEPIEKTAEHEFGDWAPDATNENKHTRECKCGATETADCTFDSGVVTKEPTHYEEGIKTYTCTVCERTKTEPIAKTTEHEFGDWAPDALNEDKHIRECKCGAAETADCTFDSGVVTKEPTHYEEGVKTYTCTVCGRTKTEPIAKTTEHEFGDWEPDQVTEDKHIRECKCGATETADCTFDEDDTCTVCGREKSEEIDGIIIVIAGGTATFEGKETVTTYSNIYGENATVYIAQEKDVLNVTLTDQAGRVFKYWMSATGTIIPDEDFSMLVFKSGYYYPVFEDTDANAFSSRVKIYEGNCEEGTLYMSINSKGDIKYELEFDNYGHHYFDETVDYNSQYHKQECLICGETIFEEHTEYRSEIEKEAGHTEEGLIRYECYCGHVWTEAIPVTDEHSVDYDDWHIIEESKNGQYGKYRVYCKYCDYYEEYWYLGGLDFIGFMDNTMINYQYTYGGKVCHNEFYYSYKNAKNQKVYIWTFQYEYENASNRDYNDTYIFMYVDDENSTTIEPIYLSKSRGG